MKFSSVKTYYYFAFFFFSLLFFVPFPVYASLPLCHKNHIPWATYGYHCGGSLPITKLFCRNGGYDCWLKPMCGDSDAQKCSRSGFDDSDEDGGGDEGNDPFCPNFKVKINTFPYKTGTVKLRCNNN